MSEKSSGGNGGSLFVSLLTIAFIVLKLTKVISWSWLWVLSPLWISTGLAILITLVLVFIIKKEKKNER